MTPVGQFLEVWRYIAIGVASLFLLWQMVAYVKFSHQWAGSWYQASVEAKASFILDSEKIVVSRLGKRHKFL